MEADTKASIDADRVNAILSKFTPPTEVEQVITTYGTDHTGDPAVFLTFIVKADVELGPKDFRRMSDYIRQVTDALFSGGIGGFAYTRIRPAA